MQRSAYVIGGGIAGLATAVALNRGGWTVRVFERATTLRATGGGIGITPNGMRALDALGLGDDVRARAVTQSEGGVRVPSGRWLARSELGFVERRYGDAIRALHRFDLLCAIAAALPPGALRFGTSAEVMSFGTATAPAVIRAGESELEADVVVAADGIHSATRHRMHPHHPGLRSTGAVSWRCVVPSDGLSPVAAETWGRGLRLSILPLPRRRVHFSALARLTARGRAGHAGGPAPLFGHWHDPIPALLDRAREHELFFDRIEELVRPLGTFVAGRVALAGDAAHAMTPNVGSANLALEDAVELGSALSCSRTTPDAALAAYDIARRPRTARLATMSRWMGRVAELSPLPAVAARNAGVWLGGFLPESVSRGSMDAMVSWTPPR
ncbi:FAD-dependent monooxygenase [Saccharomonospora xinjiangensis]|uniref:FAD-dependent monooxygenase n=1 Tax=Saccharomonospora xinjiangensis TaxID=75294 RepID=UPI0010C53474|nr:FAD-dependent monooxygenase [Saccharomonospora xinjiangensis]QBQ60549.1 FAD-dependent urate hydroxylase [Saccharomonospora xinjiangensis]